MELQTQQEAAAAVVAALYLACLLGTAFNLRATGFKLYIPLSVAALVRAVSFSVRVAYNATGNTQLVAVTRVLQAIGLGISIAMCSCFVIIWLRNVRPHHQPRPAPGLITVLCKLLVACVIAMGPLLGIVAAGLANSQGQPLLQYHGLEARKASITGFVVLIGVLTLTTAFVAVNWLVGSAASRQSTQRQQQEQQQLAIQQQCSACCCTHWRQQLRGDGLIVLLLCCDVLLLWSAAASLASLTYPELPLNPNLQYPIMVLPELIVALVFASPTLAARIALGASYPEWRQQQAMPLSGQELGLADAAAAGKSKPRSRDGDGFDLTALADGAVEEFKGGRV